MKQSNDPLKQSAKGSKRHWAGPDGLRPLDDEATFVNAVLCSHGVVMRRLLRHLRRGHVAIIGNPGRRSCAGKGRSHVNVDPRSGRAGVLGADG